MKRDRKGGEETLRDDLMQTVRELSVSYEELSLLYRLSETLAGLDVEEICTRIIEEARASIDVETAAVLFLDDNLDELFTQSCTGDWDSAFAIRRNDTLLWDSLRKEKSIAVCDLESAGMAKAFPGIRSILVCPMIGKKRTIGVLVVANKSDCTEFFSNDMKLVSSIARQAALFIENAVLTREMENFLLGTIRSFVKALEASSLWTAGHTERVTEYALGVGKEIGLNPDGLERLKICALLHDIGKIATPKEILNKEAFLSHDEWVEIRRHPGIGAGILEGLEKFTDVIECIKYHHEYYDGENSIHGMKGDDIPLLSRILAVADAFDAMTSDRPYRKRKSADEAAAEIIRKSGTQFDPKVVEGFKRWHDRMKDRTDAAMA